MRLAAGDGTWDRLVPALVLPYAAWTLYVHAIVALQASFTTLLRGLPLLLLVAVAATLGWFRLRDPAAGPAPVASRRAAADAAGGIEPFAVLAIAIALVALLSAGLPYPVFWCLGLAGLGLAWVRQLRAGPDAPSRPATARHAAWIVPGVAVAAACVVLFAHRPDADDAFHQSIPATLLRLPDQPVLLHDTLYRLADAPILLPFYRLANYDVLVAVVARATGIGHAAAAYLFLPSLFAVSGVLAWAYLLRRLVPARWPLVLAILFACVLALGETHRAYGNFAFVRLFQGKAILATCMVPAIAGAALVYARHGGIRHWLLLFATQVAGLGLSASALFVAPAAAALGLAGGWAPDRVRSRRFLAGMLATGYVLAAAWLVTSTPRGEQVLAVAGGVPAPGMPEILARTWGAWSTRVLLVALLSAWAFVREPARARYLCAGAFCFLLVALGPYSLPLIGDHSIGIKTYWRLTWALPLPVFLAITLDGLLARVLALRAKPVAVACCAILAALAFTFGARFGTLRHANHVRFAVPGPKVPPLEHGTARRLVEHVPERGTVLAPEAVAAWLPTFAVHPRPIGVRQMYLSLAFAPRDTARRSNMMRLVAGKYRPPDARRWFLASLRRYDVQAVVVSAGAPWRAELEGWLFEQGWRPLSCGGYDILVDARRGSASARTTRCPEPPAAIGRP